MKKSVSLFCLLNLLLAFPALAQTPLFDEVSRSFKKNTWDFRGQTSYYSATANYSDDGNVFNTLPDGYSYNLLAMDFGFRWVPQHKWGLYTSSQVGNAESKDAINTRTNSSLTHLVIGTDYLMSSGKTFSWAPDFSLVIPFSRVDATADEVLNHEGAVEATARMMMTARYGHLMPFGSLGLTFRDEDRSSLIPYSLGSEFNFSKVSLGAELRGYQTVIKDKYTNTPSEREGVATKNGQALKFFSVDPSLLETNLWLRSRIGNSFGFKVGGGISLTGASVSAGWNVFAALSYTLGASTRNSQDDLEPVISEDPKGFQEETNDGVNQELFQVKPTAPPPPKPNPADQKKKLQKELDNTEFQIELKSSKPRKKRR
jgi:hypothetical protein